MKDENFIDLQIYIESLNHKAVAQFLQEYPELVSFVDQDMLETPLHYAMKARSDEIVDILLQKGAKVNAGDSFKSTPLHEAAYYNYFYGANALIDHGADVNAVDNNNSTPLHKAMLNKDNFALIKLLLEKGANPNIAIQELYRLPGEHNLTPLHLAAWTGDLEAVTLLVSYNADVTKTTKDGQTASEVYQDIFGKPKHKQTRAEAKAEFEAAVAKGKAEFMARKQAAQSEEKSIEEEKSPSSGNMYNKHAGQPRSSSEREDSSTPETPEPAMKKVRIDSIQPTLEQATQSIEIKT
jgi:ankyrin repeat protein